MLTKYHKHFFHQNVEIKLDKSAKDTIVSIAEAENFTDLCENWQKYRKNLQVLWHKQSRIFAKKSEDGKITVLAIRFDAAKTYTLEN